MILTCPQCASRYFVDDHKLGPAGRTVRCASCGGSWRAHSDEPLELTNTAEEGAVASEPISFRPPVEPQPQSLADVPAPELPKAYREKTRQKRRMREAAVAGIVWGGMVGAFALLFGAAYLFRVDVVKLYPAAAGAYAKAGVPVNPIGLEFEQVQAATAEGGLPAVIVSGQVRNVDRQPMTAPPIRVSLLDKAGKKFTTQTITLAPARLGPGQARRFSVTLPDPTALAADVDLVFDLDQGAPGGHGHGKAAGKGGHGEKAAAHPAPELRPTVGVESAMAQEAAPLPEGDPNALESHGEPAHH